MKSGDDFFDFGEKSQFFTFKSVLSQFLHFITNKEIDAHLLRVAPGGGGIAAERARYGARARHLKLSNFAGDKYRLKLLACALPTCKKHLLDS